MSVKRGRLRIKYWDEVVVSYDFNKEIKTDKSELLGIELQKITSGMMNIDEMTQFIEKHENDVLFKFNTVKRHSSYFKDKELSFIHELLDDTINNRLLAYDGYTPSMRGIFPSNLLRAELLKSIKYPEISYRKFCGDDKTYEGHKEINSYTGLENKQNRAFIGLPLNKKKNDKPCSNVASSGQACLLSNWSILMGVYTPPFPTTWLSGRPDCSLC